MQWIVTSACDLHCPHCYSAAGKRTTGELTTEEVQRLVIDELVALGYFQACAGITQPIFEGGRLRAQVDQVTAQQKQSLESYRKAAYTAFREVNDALVKVRQSGGTEDAYTNAMKAAKRALQLAQVRYDGGYSPYLDVLTAQRTANDATLAWVQNRQARLSATVELFKALGGGWNNS